MSYLVTNGEHQHHGLGSFLLPFTMNTVGNRRILGDAVEEMLDFYRRYGLEVSGTKLYMFKARLRSTMSEGNIELTHDGCSTVGGIKIEGFTTEALERISNYEKSLSNLDRKIMFSQYMDNKETNSYCCYAVNCDGEVSGYAIGKGVKTKLVLVHLSAEDTITAKALLERVVAEFRNQCDHIVLRTPHAAPEVSQAVIGNCIEEEIQLMVRISRVSTQRFEPFVDWRKVYATSIDMWVARH